MYTYTSPYCPIRQSDAGFLEGGFPETPIICLQCFICYTKGLVSQNNHLSLISYILIVLTRMDIHDPPSN